MSITLLQLRTQIRDRTDKQDSEFVEDTELNNYINSSLAELHDILVQSYGNDYFLDSTTFTTIAQQTEYEFADITVGSDTLDELFFKIHGVDAKINNDQYFSISKFNFNERNRFQTGSAWDALGVANVRYRVVGNRIIFAPAPDGNTTIRLWYVPKPPLLIDDTDELDDVNYWSEYIITDVSIKVLQKEESDTSVFERQKIALKRRIEEAAQNRDSGEPDSISDIYAQNDPFWYTRFRG